MAKCRQCGQNAGWMMQICDPCSQAATEKFDQQQAELRRLEIQANQPATIEAALTKRYRDAYMDARTTNGFGDSIKGLGVVLATLIVLGTVIVAGQLRSDIATTIWIAGIVSAALVGLIFYLIGTIVSALGQIHKANVDIAVNSSPFLNNEHRASIMSLPNRNTIRASG